MAFREIAMWEILEVLQRDHRGETQRAIQRATGHSRITIRRWAATSPQLSEAGYLPRDEAMHGRMHEKSPGFSRATG